MILKFQPSTITICNTASYRQILLLFVIGQSWIYDLNTLVWTGPTFEPSSSIY